MPPGYLGPIPAYDITATIARWLGRGGPTGRQDKILIVTNSHDRHSDCVAEELLQRGASVCRFHTEDFLRACQLSLRIGDPDAPPDLLALPTDDLALEEVQSVWFRRPDLPVADMSSPEDAAADFARRESEAVLQGLFGALNRAFWVSHPTALKTSDNKIAQLKLAESLGFRIPRTLVTNEPQCVRDFFEACRGEMIVKTFRGWSGSFSGKVQAICTSRVLAEHLDHLHLVQGVPCLFQEYVPKDVELRITIIGRRVFAVEIHSQCSPISRDDWRRYDLANTPYYPTTLPSDVEAACLRLLDHYHLAYGAIDMIRRPDGAYIFLELNANGQWLWIQRMTGLPLVEAMADLLIRGSLD